jgi:hypothetical protein
LDKAAPCPQGGRCKKMGGVIDGAGVVALAVFRCRSYAKLASPPTNYSEYQYPAGPHNDM